MPGEEMVRFECAQGCEDSEWDVWGDWRAEEQLVFGEVVHGAPRDPVAARVFVPERGINGLLCPSCLALGRWQPSTDEEDR